MLTVNTQLTISHSFVSWQNFTLTCTGNWASFQFDVLCFLYSTTIKPNTMFLSYIATRVVSVQLGCQYVLLYLKEFILLTRTNAKFSHRNPGNVR